MFSFRLILVLVFLSPFSFSKSIFAQAARISMDGYFSDWSHLRPIYSDPLNTPSSNNRFFGKLWAANDERFLFLRIEVRSEINLQNDNRIVLYIDTDNSTATGKQIHSIGAELEWYFGEKTGSFFIERNAFAIRHSDIGLVTLPTMTSPQFEIAIHRTARPASQKPLFTNDTIRIAFENKASGDIIPAAGTGITYIFDNSPLPPISRITLNKQNKNHLRVLTYNVLRDNLFKIEKRQYFNRILKAIQPDLIGFDEIHNHSAKQTAKLIETILPSRRGQKWFCSKVGPDIVAVSRFAIKKIHPIEGNGAFFIDLRPKYDSDLLLVVAHPPSGSRNEQRQREIDAIMGFIRDARRQGGVLDLKPGTPILIIGDMNLVGYSEQLRTFLAGKIVNQKRYGPSFKPDWDGTDFTALLPLQTDLLMAYTWYDENNTFSPGRLDYIIYSDSVIKPGNHFVLFTPGMSADTLAAYGLQLKDAVQASDHLPVVGDFILPVSSEVESSDQTFYLNFVSFSVLMAKMTFGFITSSF
jgi:endonuclease/exonuclease/phosphatase family metal-dependent hydrolase